MSQLLSAIPLSSLTGVGAKVAEKLARIGLHNVQDLLFHLPARYEDRTRVYPMAKVHPGLWASVQGKVMSTDTIFGRKKMLTVKISDGNGTITLRFFNFTAAMKNNFSTDKQVHAYGEVKRGMHGLEIIHPDYKFFQPKQKLQLEQSLTPVYPTTDGLRQLTLRNLTDQALELLNKSAVLRNNPNPKAKILRATNASVLKNDISPVHADAFNCAFIYIVPPSNISSNSLICNNIINWSPPSLRYTPNTK